MQTFMPYADFDRVAQCLDYRRLGKQRVEAKQILKALHDPDYGWAKHPIVKCWRGYEVALMAYMNAMIVEWKRRGYNNRMPIVYLVGDSIIADVEDSLKPDWVLDTETHLRYRDMLILKNPEYYMSIFYPKGVSNEQENV